MNPKKISYQSLVEVPDRVHVNAMRGSVPHGKLRDAKITLVTPAKGDQLAGAVKYRKGADHVEAAVLPRGKGMFATAIRIHEGEHASVSGKRPKRRIVGSDLEETCNQIVEDCLVAGLPIPRTAHRGYKRTNIFPAFRDLRDILRNHRRRGQSNTAKSIEERNGDLLIGARCLAIARSYGDYEQNNKVCVKVAGVLGGMRYAAAKKAGELVRRGRKLGRKKAFELLMRVLEIENDDELQPDRPRGSRGDEITERLEKEKGMVQMQIMILKPQGASTVREKALSVRYAPNGVLINQTRLPAAIISGDCNGLFMRRRKIEPGGVVLIDASGSMDVDEQNLDKLCQLVPTATVAFYSGHDSGRGGILCVYAQKGKRFSGPESDLERVLWGGNAVDLPALRWLAKRPGPRYLVTDRGYCGGAWGDATAAQILTDNLLARRELSLIPSFEAAFRFFDTGHKYHAQARADFGAGPHGINCRCKACYYVKETVNEGCGQF